MESKITKSEDSVLWNDVKISLFKRTDSEEYFKNDEIEIEETESGWSLTVPIPEEHGMVAGIMIPINEYNIIIGDAHIDLDRSKRFYYKQNGELKNTLNLRLFDTNSISNPLVHFISKDKAFSWSCANECVISTFTTHGQWYINIEAWAAKTLVFFLDESNNFLVNLQRYPSKRHDVLINYTTSLSVMKKSMLLGSFARNRPDHPDNMIEIAREVQSELKKHTIESIIIGSLSRRLNSIPVDVRDIDLMVKRQEDVDIAVGILEAIADRVQDNKLIYRDIEVDICYDNYNILPNPNYIINRHDLTYISLEGLLWLYMINLLAIELDEHSDDYRDHVLNAIISIHKSTRGEFDISPYAKLLEDHSSICYDWLDRLSSAKIEYRDIKINRPLSTRCFKKGDTYFYPIVNTGSKCDAEIVVNIVPESATWQDLQGNTSPVDIIPNDGFSVIYINNVEQLGLLTCS